MKPIFPILSAFLLAAALAAPRPVFAQTDDFPHVFGPVAVQQLIFPVGALTSKDVKSIAYAVKNTSGAPVKLLSKAETHAAFGIEAPEQALAPGAAGEIKITFDGAKAKAGNLDEMVSEPFAFFAEQNGEETKIQIQLNGTFKAVFSEEELAGKPRIAFAALEHNVGEILDGKSVAYEFKFKNEGEGDLRIKAVKAECGCTATKPEADMIAPGGESFIHVKFEAEEVGEAVKNITVITNDPTQKRINLTVKANVLHNPDKPAEKEEDDEHESGGDDNAGQSEPPVIPTQKSDDNYYKPW